jgi:hypothetical protein
MAMRETKGLTEIKHPPGQPDDLRGALNLLSAIVLTADQRYRFGRRLVALINPSNLPSANLGEAAA